MSKNRAAYAALFRFFPEESALNLKEEVIPVLQNGRLMLGEVRNIAEDPLDVFRSGKQALAVNGILVGHTQRLQILSDIGAAFCGADPVDQSFRSCRVLAVFDHSHAECGSGSPVGRITHGEVVICTLLNEFDSAVFIGQTHNIFALLNQFEAVRGRVRDDEVLHKLSDIVPCFFAVIAENRHNVAEVVPCCRRAVRVGEDDLAFEFRIQEVSIAADIKAEFLLQVGVDGKYDGGQVVHGVDAVGGGVAFNGVGRYILV